MLRMFEVDFHIMVLTTFDIDFELKFYFSN